MYGDKLKRGQKYYILCSPWRKQWMEFYAAGWQQKDIVKMNNNFATVIWFMSP